MTTAAPVKWLSVAQVAEATDRHIITVYRALECGELHGHQRKRGGRWQIHPDAVDAWVQGMSGEAACGCIRLRPVKRTA